MRTKRIVKERRIRIKTATETETKIKPSEVRLEDEKEGISEKAPVMNPEYIPAKLKQSKFSYYLMIVGGIVVMFAGLISILILGNLYIMAVMGLLGISLCSWGIWKLSHTEKLPSPNGVLIKWENEMYRAEFIKLEKPQGLAYEICGTWVRFYLKKETPEGVVVQPMPSPEIIKLLPDALWRALHWDEYKELVKILSPMSGIEKLKIGLALAFFAISAFIVFLIIISLGGS